MHLQHKKETYTLHTGEKIECDTYYVEVSGVVIKLVPKDSTGKQLLRIAFTEKEGK